MRFYLDTANIDDIEKAAKLGIIEGVTTNPSLIAKEGMDFEEVIKTINTLVDGFVFAEVTALDPEEMVEEGLKLNELSDKMIIKLPCNWAGIQACKILSNKGVKVAVTLVFSANQALIAARAGAYFVAPFVGRLNDISQDGVGTLIKDIREIFMVNKIKTKIVAASLRNQMDVLNCAKAGVDVATIPYQTLLGLLNHPLTDAGLAKFMKDWDSMKNK
ncbi:fructose-6-phosphate aldolase [Alkalibacter saccharofermentans]|uniref:Transaldolase n=1 Tax=Alkalibacter saccharofermentans DSM 14828 TaxID=1120975 RepID=A0A1M4X0N5_9FIRM|nr:fructose-6-phosphate aldolase [Alkalibacter saccharofermentans]SHE87081.1 transaldolase [Alkalibacter saccharofermentans DSM 14828]